MYGDDKFGGEALIFVWTCTYVTCILNCLPLCFWFMDILLNAWTCPKWADVLVFTHSCANHTLIKLRSMFGRNCGIMRYWKKWFEVDGGDGDGNGNESFAFICVPVRMCHSRFGRNCLVCPFIENIQHCGTLGFVFSFFCGLCFESGSMSLLQNVQ